MTQLIYDLLWDGQSGDRIPVSVSFPTPIQTGSGAHPASYTNGTGSVQVVKRPGCGVDHHPHSAPRLTREKGYTSTVPLGRCALFEVNFTLP